MRRITILVLTAILILALTACGATGSKETSTTTANEKKGEIESAKIAIGHAGASTKDSPHQVITAKFKELVEKNTNGKVKVEIHPNGELGGDRELAEAVQIGTLDATYISSAPLGNFASKTNAFDFPFLFRDREHAYKVLDGELGGEIAKDLEGTGLKVLSWGEFGFRNITNSKHPIKTPADLKGLKIRTQENKIHLDAFKEYGASPTPMAFTELFTSLQQKVVDGQETPVSVIVANKFPEVQKYMTLSEHLYTPAPILINKAKFDGFSPELQKIVKEAAIAAAEYQREFNVKQTEEHLKIAKDEGMEIVTHDEFDYKAFFDASQPVYQKYQKEYGDFITRIINTK
jgi:tripartite ATP-independent transporter DctP family solute receptor